MKIFSNINFWIALFFVIRLWGITNPPIEIAHSWRQCLTADVARNFEKDPSILHPHYSEEGGKEAALEFPFFSYLIFLSNHFFGFTHWYGRLINLVVTTVGLFFFNRIVREILTGQTAFYATLIFAVSLFFSFGRKIMPDTFSVSLVLAGIYFALIFFPEINSRKNLLWILLSLLFLTLGVLCKLPSLALFGFLIFPLLNGNYSGKKKLILLCALFFSVLIVYWWYFNWNEHLVSNGATKIIFPTSLLEGLQSTIKNFAGVAEKFYFSGLRSYTALAFLLIGLVVAIIRKQKNLLLIIAGSFLLFLFFVFKAGLFFYFHSYYIIPFVPIMAMVAGFGIDQIKKVKIRTVLITVLIVESILNQQHDFINRTDMIYKTQLENLIAPFCAPQEKIVVNTGKNPQLLYFANRYGWGFESKSEIKKSSIDSLTKGQYSIVVLDKSSVASFDSTEFKMLFSDEHFEFLKPVR